jgi:hypothetical protein
MKTIVGLIVLSGLMLVVATLAAVARESGAQVGPPELAVERGILFTSDPLPTGKGAEALAEMPRASSQDSLMTMARDPSVTTLVFDRATISSVPESYLNAQLKEGKSIIAIGVPLSELAARTDFVKEATDAARTPSGDLPGNFRITLDQPIPPGEFYSFLYMTPPGSDPFRKGSAQKAFSAGLFAADLGKHLKGINSDLGK